MSGKLTLTIDDEAPIVFEGENLTKLRANVSGVREGRNAEYWVAGNYKAKSFKRAALRFHFAYGRRTVTKSELKHIEEHLCKAEAGEVVECWIGFKILGVKVTSISTDEPRKAE